MSFVRNLAACLAAIVLGAGLSFGQGVDSPRSSSSVVIHQGAIDVPGYPSPVKVEVFLPMERDASHVVACVGPSLVLGVAGQSIAGQYALGGVGVASLTTGLEANGDAVASFLAYVQNADWCRDFVLLAEGKAAEVACSKAAALGKLAGVYVVEKKYFFNKLS